MYRKEKMVVAVDAVIVLPIQMHLVFAGPTSQLLEVIWDHCVGGRDGNFSSEVYIFFP